MQTQSYFGLLQIFMCVAKRRIMTTVTIETVAKEQVAIYTCTLAM